jgi:hypothetical protein
MMSEQPGTNEPEDTSTDEAGTTSPQYGSLSVEDNPSGTVDPAELAGTAKPDDEPVGYQPSASEASEASEGTGGEGSSP